VEVHSAVARLHRSGAVNDREKQGALSRLALLRRGWREILPGDSLRELASRLLEIYTLRGSDSLQLAAALTWCQQRPAQRGFISGDQRLCDAAEAAGFVVIALVRPGP
jgi:predicted nucleic acid-binding protein